METRSTVLPEDYAPNVTDESIKGWEPREKKEGKVKRCRRHLSRNYREIHVRYQVKWFRKSSSLVIRKKKRKRNKTYIYIFRGIISLRANEKILYLKQTKRDGYWDNSENLCQSYLTKNKKRKKKDPATGKEEWNNFFHLHKQAIYI